MQSFQEIILIDALDQSRQAIYNHVEFMKASNKKKKKKDQTRTVISMVAFAYILVLLFAGIFGDMGLIKSFRLRNQNENIKQNVRSLKEQNNRLRREIDNLRGNQRYIEKLAREELNMSREDEVIFIFSE